MKKLTSKEKEKLRRECVDIYRDYDRSLRFPVKPGVRAVVDRVIEVMEKEPVQ